jgi:hypothetical protein
MGIAVLMSTSDANIKQFFERVNLFKMWSSFTIRATLFRLEESKDWEILHLFLFLDESDNSPQYQILFEDPLLRIVQEIRPITTLEDLLDNVAKGNTLKIADTPVKANSFSTGMIYDFFSREFSKDIYAIDYPCFALHAGGGRPNGIDRLERYLLDTLPFHEPSYENLEDVLNQFQVKVTSYSVYFCALAPLYLKIKSVEFGEVIDVELDCRKQTRLEKVVLSAIGRDRTGKSTSLRKVVKAGDWIREGMLIKTKFRADEQSSAVSLKLRHEDHDKLIEHVVLERKGTELGNKYWIKFVQNRLDPDLDALERWLDTGGKNSSDFETAVAILLYLCGLRTANVGSGYENATLQKRREKHGISKAPVDILAWSIEEDELYLCQCSTEGVNQKELEVATFASEISEKLRESAGPRVHAVIITNVLRENIKHAISLAEAAEIKVVTIDDLKILLEDIRANKRPYEKAKTILTYVDESKTLFTY